MENILAPGIVVYENFINDPLSLINEIESLDNKIKNNKEKTILKTWEPWIYGYNNQDRPQLCLSKIMPSENELSRSDIFYNDQLSITKKFDKAIFETLEKYYSVYPRLKKNIESREFFTKILKYEKGSMMPTHSDMGSTSRALSCIVYLGDNYEGGEIIFDNFNIKIKPSSGSVLFFPSSFVYTHEVLPIKNGIRYSYPVWFHNQKNPIMPIPERRKVDDRI